MNVTTAPSKRALLRDLVILQIKLVVDALKDVFLIKLALAAVILDLLFHRPGKPMLFYAVLRLGERFDLWLNLYSPAHAAEQVEEGLFGASRAGANTLLGKLEQLAKQKSEDFGRWSADDY